MESSAFSSFPVALMKKRISDEERHKGEPWTLKELEWSFGTAGLGGVMDPETEAAMKSKMIIATKFVMRDEAENSAAAGRRTQWGLGRPRRTPYRLIAPEKSRFSWYRIVYEMWGPYHTEQFIGRSSGSTRLPAGADWLPYPLRELWQHRRVPPKVVLQGRLATALQRVAGHVFVDVTARTPTGAPAPFWTALRPAKKDADVAG